MINLDVLKRMPNDMKLEDAINILDVAKLVGEDFWYHHDNKWRSLIQPTELMEKISDNQIVNVYAVTRRYGGPEEGGWWYDQHQHIAAFKFDDNKIRRPMIEELFKEKYAEGDLNSVRGGVEIIACIENEIAENETKSKPRYE